MEKARKAEDRIFLLITTEDNKYRAQVKVDTFIEKFYTNA